MSNYYKVKYQGRSSRFKDFEYEVSATSLKDAVRKVYSKFCDDNYFPQDDGTVKDCTGHIISIADENTIDYDLGYFWAEIIE